MIEGLHPYPEYKQSGLPWLGSIPVSWGTPRTKTRFRLSIEKSGKNHGKELLSIYTHIGVRPRKDLEERGNKASTTNDYWVVRKGDIIVNKLLAWMGAVGVSHFDGVTSPAYDILRPIQVLEPNFFHLLFRTKLYLQLFKSRSRGIMDMRLRLYFDELGQIPLICPPPEEQASIVRFLSHANRKIDGFIRAKRKLIALLGEQKQAIIHRAVTRGLDPNAPLKPSGISWLGDIPKHWNVWRISRLAKVGNGSTPSRSNMGFWTGGNYPWLNSSHVNRVYVDSADQFVTSAALRECHLPKVAAGSVLIAITGQGKTRGTSAVLGIEATINQHIAYITPRVPVVTTQHLHLSLVAAYTTLRSMSDDSGSTKGALTCEDLKRFKVAVPPMAEQERVLEAVATETSAANTAIARTEREIALMQEYRTRLTADIVTGKLDVRAAAAKLPDASAANIGAPSSMDNGDMDIADETEIDET